MCIHSLDCVQLYCQVVGDRTSTHMLHLLHVSQETDDLLVLVIDYYGPVCTTVCIALIYTSHDFLA